LASAFLSSVHVLTWFEALLVGEYEPIEDNIPDEWKGNKRLGFKPRPCGSTSRDRLIQKELEGCAGKFSFSVESGWTDNWTGMARPRGFQNGQAFKQGTIQVEIAFERMLPFLKEKYTRPERQVDVFNIAFTILNETCVRRTTTILPDFSPYFLT
jgi:hypothetical protein